MDWLQETYGLDFTDYQALWDWSVTELELFWETIWAYFDIQASRPYTTVLPERKMPGAQWFPGAKLNYAENIFRNATAERPALLYQSETEPLTEMSWHTLEHQTRLLSHHL